MLAAERDRGLDYKNAAKAKIKTTNKAGGMKKPNLKQLLKAAKAAGFLARQRSSAAAGEAPVFGIHHTGSVSPLMQCFEQIGSRGAARRAGRGRAFE